MVYSLSNLICDILRFTLASLDMAKSVKVSEFTNKETEHCILMVCILGQGV